MSLNLSEKVDLTDNRQYGKLRINERISNNLLISEKKAYMELDKEDAFRVMVNDFTDENGVPFLPTGTNSEVKNIKEFSECLSGVRCPRCGKLLKIIPWHWDETIVGGLCEECSHAQEFSLYINKKDFWRNPNYEMPNANVWWKDI